MNDGVTMPKSLGTELLVVYMREIIIKNTGLGKGS